MSKSIVVDKKPLYLEDTPVLDDYIKDSVRIRPEIGGKVPRRYNQPFTPLADSMPKKQAWPSIHT